MLRDVRVALRSLASRPGSSLIVVATLALGIGVNTALFSVLNAVLLRPLPYPEPDRVMTVWESNPGIGIDQDQASAGNFVDWQQGSRSFQAMAAYRYGGHVLTELDEPERITTLQVTPELFGVLGATPMAGRLFGADDEQEGSERRILLSHRLWARHFGSDPRIVEQTIRLDGEGYSVVGVMPRGFEFPPDEEEVEAWTPLTIPPRLINVRGMRVYNIVGRLAPGITPEQATQELDTIAAEIATRFPDTNRGWGAQIVSAQEQLVGDIAPTLMLLGGAAALVLLIACVNVASLMLARSLDQQRELAIRGALGAGKGALLRRSLTDGLVLALVGGVTGLVLAAWSMDFLRASMPAELPRLREMGVDLSVLIFSAVASIGSGLLVGLIPGFRAIRPRLADVLQESGQSHSGGRGARRVLNLMVTAEVALALVLLVAAGLLIRSYRNLNEVDPGFRIDGVVSMALSLPESLYPDRGSQVQAYHDLVDRVAALPGVQAAGAVTALPMSTVGMDFDLPFQIEGAAVVPQTDRPRAEYRAVIPGYFDALGIPLQRGRLIDGVDRQESRPVMVINETMARTHFPGIDPIGQFLGVPMAGRIEIVGVVGDVRHRGLGSEPRPEMFVSYQQFALRDMHLVVRSPGAAAQAIAAVQQQVRELDPRLPIRRAAALRELVGESLAQPRFNMLLLGALAGCALILAAVGIYGVISYSVVQRRAEIGIRMAMGADAASTVRLVVAQSMAFVMIGIGVGFLGALGAGRLVAGLIYGVSPTDAATILVVAATLLGVGVAAAAVPARRASRVDPVATLRRQ